MNDERAVQIKVITAIVLLLSITILYVSASETEVLTVGPYTERILIINLDENCQFVGSLSISGGDDDINFWVTNPTGDTIVNLSRVSQEATFEFTAQQTGDYTLHFDNSFSFQSSKTVTLSYDATKPSLFNNPIFILLIAIIAIIVIVVVLVRYVKRQKPKARRKRNSRLIKH